MRINVKVLCHKFSPQRTTEKKQRATEFILYCSVVLYLLCGSLWACINIQFNPEEIHKLYTHMYKRRLFFIVMLLVQYVFVEASDSIPLVLNGNKFRAGDTLSFTWDGTVINKGYPKASMHLWADHMESGQRWKFRYPVLNGVSEADIVLSDSLPEGTYALNFMAVEQFLEIRGRVKKVKVKMAYNKETKKRDTIMVEEIPRLGGKEMRYTLLGMNADILQNDFLQVDAGGKFKIASLVFGDSVQLMFDPGRGRGEFYVDLITPLDSAFTPFYSETVFVRIGKDSAVMVTDTSNYSFGFDDTFKGVTLEEVIVKGKSNARKFEEAFVSIPFRGGPDAKTFEGLDTDEIMRTNNIYLFLKTKVPGLMIRQLLNETTISWRGEPVSIFLNEMPIGANNLNIAPMDVALIKVYPPPVTLGPLIPGGAIAIYTKRGEYEGGGKGEPRYNFLVRGYTQGILKWD